MASVPPLAEEAGSSSDGSSHDIARCVLPAHQPVRPASRNLALEASPRERWDGVLTFLGLEGDLGGGGFGAALTLLAALAGERCVCLQLPVGLGATQGTIPCPSGAAHL